MHIFRFLICFSLVVGLGACSNSGKVVRDKSTAFKPATYNYHSTNSDAKTFHIYVGSMVDKQRKEKSQDTIEVSGIKYAITNSLVSQTDIRAAFVAKTIIDEPALGLRLDELANKRLKLALTKNKKNIVLASLNNSVFSKVGNTGAEFQDGVLLLPMRSLNEARDVADLFRFPKNY